LIATAALFVLCAFPPLALDVIAYGAQNDRPLVSRLKNIGMLADSCRKANASIPNPGESFTAIGSARSSTSLSESPRFRSVATALVIADFV